MAYRSWIGSALHLPGRFHPQFREGKKNRRDIGKSQSIWTDSKMETPGSPPQVEAAPAGGQ
jgi:hypothetical protein